MIDNEKQCRPSGLRQWALCVCIAPNAWTRASQKPKKPLYLRTTACDLVPRRRLELPRCYSLVPETSASTNSATWAFRMERIIGVPSWCLGQLGDFFSKKIAGEGSVSVAGLENGRVVHLGSRSVGFLWCQKQKSRCTLLCSGLLSWCPGEDSNFHDVTR